MKRRQCLLLIFLVIIRQSMETGRAIWIYSKDHKTYFSFSPVRGCKLHYEVCGDDVIEVEK